MDLTPDSSLLWPLLHAAGVPDRARIDVVRAGGPAAVLAHGAVNITTRGRAECRRLDREQGQRRLSLLAPFLSAGGRIVDDDDSLDRLTARAPALCLYACGAACLVRHRPLVAIVGARDCDEQGRRSAQAAARAAVALGAVVVSGGARGIDRAAHEAALAAGGATIAVMGETARVPQGSLARLLRCDRGLWLTSFPPWRAPLEALHAARNVTIAALADVVIVVQGELRSGTGITAAHAERLLVPLLAVPGPTQARLAATPNALIAQGRAMALPTDDDAALRTALAIALDRGTAARTVPETVPETVPTTLPPCVPPSTAPSPLLALLQNRGGRLLVDDAAQALCIPLASLLAEAALHELDGSLVREGSCLVSARPDAAHCRPHRR